VIVIMGTGPGSASVVSTRPFTDLLGCPMWSTSPVQPTISRDVSADTLPAQTDDFQAQNSPSN